MQQAIVLAGGEGRRLRPFTVNRPKAMLSIAAKPILQYVIEALVHNGIRNIVIVAGYRRQQVFDYFGSGERLGVDIKYIVQEDQLGTANALALAAEAAEDHFLVMHGDDVVGPGIIAPFVNVDKEAIMVKRVSDPSRYGVVSAAGGKLQRIEEKPREPSSNLVNTGIYVFSRKIFDYIGAELGLPDVLNKMVQDGNTINVVETEEPWHDAVYPWDIVSLNETVLASLTANLAGTIEKCASIRGPVSIGKGTVIRAGSYIMGPVLIGEGCEIGPNACIWPSTSIGDNVTVGPFSEIRNSVINEDAHIGAGAVIQNSVIDCACNIKERFSACSDMVEVGINGERHQVDVGAMVGEGCRLDSEVFAEPGVIVGNYCQVKARRQISGRLPDKSLMY